MFQFRPAGLASCLVGVENNDTSAVRIDFLALKPRSAGFNHHRPSESTSSETDCTRANKHVNLAK